MANLADIKQGFGVVTVFNAKCIAITDLIKVNDVKTAENWANYCKTHTPAQIAKTIVDAFEVEEYKDKCFIDSLKISNLNVEGPSKTITGGQYANPLIKFGKTATCEMQDALGRTDALALLGGMEIDASSQIHMTSKFGKPVAIIGETFIIDRISGDQVPVTEVIYQFVPDSIISLTQQSDGDASVFDLNGSIMATDVLKTEKTGSGTPATYYHGTFYSIIDHVEPTAQL